MSPTTGAKPKRRKPHELEELIVGLLQASDLPLGGQEISRRLSTPERRVVPILVFRALTSLIKRRAVCRVESFSAYIIAPKQPSITLLCTECRSCHIIPDANIIVRLEGLAAARSFVPHRCVVEVKGQCPRCDQRTRRAGHAWEKRFESRPDIM